MIPGTAIKTGAYTALPSPEKVNEIPEAIEIGG